MMIATPFLWYRPKAEQLSVELALLPPAEATFHWLQPGVISPDGQTFAFVAEAHGKSELWLRRLDSKAGKPLPGTEGASAPFWSPDGRFIAFFADRKLKKVAIAGGSPQVLCHAAAGRGGAWSPHGIIVFAPQILGALFRVADSGGEPVPLTRFDRSLEQNAHYWPQFLPDGRRFIYFARSGNPELSTLELGSVDLPPESNPAARFVHTLSNAAYAPGRGNRLPQILFVRGETLLAQAFDESTLKVKGEPVAIVEGVGSNAFVGLADFSVSENNVLVYGGGSNLVSELTWRGRDGAKLGSIEASASYLAPRLSPDGGKLAVSRADLGNGNADIWIFDSVRNTSSRLTFNPALDLHAVWSADGKRCAVFIESRWRVQYLSERRHGSRTREADHENRIQSVCGRLVARWAVCTLCAAGRPHYGESMGTAAGTARTTLSR